MTSTNRNFHNKIPQGCWDGRANEMDISMMEMRKRKNTLNERGYIK